MSKPKRVLTGIKPTGELHLGNYLAAIKPGLKWQENNECLFFIADLHALITNKDPKAIHSDSLDQVAAWIALGLDVKKHILWKQSDNPSVTEFTWYLSCVTGLGLLEKAHAYKDALAQGKEVNHGLFAYPALMASDILMYDTDVVPVGKDQKQHIEFARDMAGSFNAIYGERIIKLPEASIVEAVMTVPGLDGRKMSKSYNNYIPLFADEKSLRKLVMSIKSDSTPLEAPKELEGSLIGDLYKLFTTDSEFRDLSLRMKNGGMGWGHAKEELAQMINRELSAPREKYNEIRKDEKHLNSVLKEGLGRAREISEPVLQRVRRAVGF